ncbi:MAG TPA: hypothetical protein PKY83_08230, partial [Bacteroidales bacterium]|nr:hypothetical protein [Bacteroidales bacterium]
MADYDANESCVRGTTSRQSAGASPGRCTIKNGEPRLKEKALHSLWCSDHPEHPYLYCIASARWWISM